MTMNLGQNLILACVSLVFPASKRLAVCRPAPGRDPHAELIRAQEARCDAADTGPRRHILPRGASARRPLIACDSPQSTEDGGEAKTRIWAIRMSLKTSWSKSLFCFSLARKTGKQGKRHYAAATGCCPPFHCHCNLFSVLHLLLPFPNCTFWVTINHARNVQ